MEDRKPQFAVLFLAVLAGSAGGCSTVTDLAGIPHAGHQPTGGYVLLASEQDFNCRRLSDEIELGLGTMKAEHARFDAERATLPQTMETLYGRMFGGANGGLRSAESYRNNEVRVRALNRQLEAKGCHSVDVDARILAFNLAPINGSTTTGSVVAGGSATGVGPVGIAPQTVAVAPVAATSAPGQDLGSELRTMDGIIPISH